MATTEQFKKDILDALKAMGKKMDGHTDEWNLHKIEMKGHLEMLETHRQKIDKELLIRSENAYSFNADIVFNPVFSNDEMKKYSAEFRDKLHFLMANYKIVQVHAVFLFRPPSDKQSPDGKPEIVFNVG